MKWRPTSRGSRPRTTDDDNDDDVDDDDVGQRRRLRIRRRSTDASIDIFKLMEKFSKISSVHFND